MASIRQKVTAAGNLGLFFIEQGKILPQAEYRAFNPVPLRISTIKKLYGSWSKAIRFIKNSQPDIWAEIQKMEHVVSDEEALATLNYDSEEAKLKQKMTDALKSKPVKEAVEEE